MDNLGSTRMADSGMVDLKKLGEMWKSLGDSEKDVSMRPVSSSINVIQVATVQDIRTLITHKPYH